MIGSSRLFTRATEVYIHNSRPMFLIFWGLRVYIECIKSNIDVFHPIIGLTYTSSVHMQIQEAYQTLKSFLDLLSMKCGYQLEVKSTAIIYNKKYNNNISRKYNIQKDDWCLTIFNYLEVSKEMYIEDNYHVIKAKKKNVLFYLRHCFQTTKKNFGEFEWSPAGSLGSHPHAW